jgi:zinc transport system ATP-binding protein
LLKVVLGLLKADSGIVSVKPGLRVGYVPQRLHLHPTLPISVRRLMRLTRRHAEADLLEALGETGVAHLIDADATSLSGGELQRVLIARALLAGPELLVLDEPVQGVDFAGEVALYEKIADIRRRHGCAILLVSHDLHVVMAASDRVVCLNGHVCCAGMHARLPKPPSTCSCSAHGRPARRDLPAPP